MALLALFVLTLFPSLLLAASDVKIISVDTGIVSSPREVIDLDEEFLKQFESDDSWITGVYDDDGDFPEITEIKFDEKEIQEGDYITNGATLTATLADLESGIQAWNVRVFNTETDVEASSVTENLTSTSNSVSLSQTLSTLDAGSSYVSKVHTP